MKKAVEWLAENYKYVTWLRNRDEISPGRADDLREHFLRQAKEMEKQQIIDAHFNGCEIGEMFNNENRAFITDSEQYYTETFNKK
jgi:hypothetical protein